VDQVLAAYFEAWNEPDAGERSRLLELAVTDDAELIDPTGRWQGIDGLSERIARYHAAAPGNPRRPGERPRCAQRVTRYAWRIVDADDGHVMEGLDVRANRRRSPTADPHVPRAAA